MAIQSVGVVGTGTMGQGIMQVCAQAGLNVYAYDVTETNVQRAILRIVGFFTKAVEKGTLAAAERQSALEHLHKVDALKGLASVDLVIEAVDEQINIKATLFAELDRLLPSDRLLATNTSSLSISKLAAATKRPDKVIGLHFFNPVPLMGLVEVVTGQETARDTTEDMCEFVRQLGKEPLVCKDSAGFVSNRIGMLMINEAVECLHAGIATRESIDGIMRLGFNHPTGPLALADLIGIDVCLDIMRVLHRDLDNDKYKPCPLLETMVAEGRLGKKAGRGFYKYD